MLRSSALVPVTPRNDGWSTARSRLALLLLFMGLLACNPDALMAGTPDAMAGPSEGCSIPPGASPREVVHALASCYGVSIDYLTNNRLDILFLLDNSSGSLLFQKVLLDNIPELFRKLNEGDVDYHVGVASSDVGSWQAPGKPWTIPFGACDSFEGDDGVLQRVPCTTRTNTSSVARDFCTALCPDPSFVPMGGHAFISRENGITNVPVAISKDPKTGKDIDTGPQRAFQCIGLLEDGGCGLEAHLEGARRALDGHRKENQGFLRSDSVLALLILADDDDCSASPAGRAEFDPATMDCPSPDREAPFSCFGVEYRCIAREIICDQALNIPGSKTNCKERDKSFLEPVSTYTQFFQTLRPANKLIMSGILTPSIDKGGKVVSVQKGPKNKSYDLYWGEQAEAACFDANDPTIFGQPEIRLSKFVAQFPGGQEANICDRVAYSEYLGALADTIKGRLKANCVSTVPRLKDGQPLCVVGDVDEGTPDAIPTVAFPACSAPCCQAFAASDAPTPKDPAVAMACLGETADACFCALPSTRPGICAGGAVAGVWRKGRGFAPTGKLTSFHCAK